MHGEPAEISASALDALFGIELETVAVKKWPGRKTDVRGDAQPTQCTQRRLHALVKPAGDTAPSERGMSKEKVQIAVAGIRGETCKCTLRLSDDGVKPRQPLLPACDIGWDGCPRSKLLW